MWSGSHLVGLPLLAGLVLLLLGLENVTLLFAGDVDLGLGGQKVPLVHPAEGATVQGVRTADEEKAGAELLEDDDLPSLVDSGEDDGDDTGAQGWPEGPLLLGEQVLGGLVDDLDGCWVVELWLDGRNLPGSSVLGAADLLLDEDRLLSCSRLGSGLLGELVDGLLVVHLAAAVLVNAGLQRSVPRATDLGCRHVEIVFFSD